MQITKNIFQWEHHDQNKRIHLSFMKIQHKAKLYTIYNLKLKRTLLRKLAKTFCPSFSLSIHSQMANPLSFLIARGFPCSLCPLKS